MSSTDPRTGTLLDRRYRLLERIGEGGAGVVYRARHEAMDRTVAIKVLSHELFPGPVAFERFRREARAAGALVHPNAVTIFDFGSTESDEPYIAMEYCDGGALADRLLAGERFGAAEIARLLAGVAAAVDAAHARGIVHRDLKPGNILFSGGVPKVADFGLARMLDREADPGLTGNHAIGSPFFMSPEQCSGRPAGKESDVYSLGVIAYLLATGEVPFRRGTAQEVLLAHLTESPRPPDEVAPGLPRAFAHVIRRALAKAPRLRPTSAGELAIDLARSLLEATTVETPVSPLSSGSVRIRRPLSDRSSGAPTAPIARDGELAAMEELLAHVLEGDGQILTIAGEPGAGKSMLAHAFLRRAQSAAPGLLSALGRSPEHHGSTEAYAPFLDALGRLLAGGARETLAPLLASLAPTWAAHFPGLPATDAGGGDPAYDGERSEALAGRRSRDRMPRELAAFVEAVARERPLVLLLEDLQWADPASVDLLLHLVPRLDGIRLLLVGTYRPGEVEADPRHPFRAALSALGRGGAAWTEIQPPAFGAAAVAAYLARELGAPPPDELVAFVLRRTEGNPLFLVNVLAHLRESGAIEVSGGQVRLARSLDSVERIVPEGIVALLREKVDRLDPDDRRLLSAASVEGLEFTSSVAARLTGRDELEIEERLRHLHSAHRLVETMGELELPTGHATGRYRFVHSLYQHAFYDDLPPRRRAALHLEAARALAAEHAGRLEPLRQALAAHYEKGRDFTGAIDELLAAAETAAWRNPKDAGPLLARALEVAAKLPEGERARRRAGLLVRLARHEAETAEFAGDVALYDRAESSVAEALALEPGSPSARTVLGLIHLERGENERAFVDFARALERDAAHAEGWDGLSYLFKNTGLWSASLAAQERAASLDRRFASSIRKLSVLIYRASAEAVAYADAMVSQRPKFAHYNYWRGIASWYAGDRFEARRFIEQGYGLDPADPIAQGVLAFVLAADGEATRARELLATAEPGASADGTFTYWIAKVHAQLGDTGAALDWLDRARKLGYWDGAWMRSDRALAALHPLPEFERLAGEVEARRAKFVGFVEKESPAALTERVKAHGS